MTDDQLLRYSRHILLGEVGIEGQQRVLAGHVLIVGAGGLGSPAALYLATAGIGRLTLVDDDRVDLTNLQRQIAHATDRIGSLKVESARVGIGMLNAAVDVRAVAARADATLLARLVPEADVVIDASDNFATRQMLNAASVAHGKPLVSGAASGFDGQVAVFDPRDPSSPCYACLYPPGAAPTEATCATLGVFAPLVGIVGSVQAAEALKLLVGIGRSLAGRLQLLDALAMDWTELAAPRRADCNVCASRPLFSSSRST